MLEMGLNFNQIENNEQKIRTNNKFIGLISLHNLRILKKLQFFLFALVKLRKAN